MKAPGWREDRDGNMVPPWAPSWSTNVGVPTPKQGEEYECGTDRRMSPPNTQNEPRWFFRLKTDRISKPMPVREALDIMGIDYKE